MWSKSTNMFGAALTIDAVIAISTAMLATVFVFAAVWPIGSAFIA